MRFVSIILIGSLILNGCATVPPPTPVVPDNPDKRVEEQPLPVDPAAMVPPAQLPKEEWVEPLEAGGCVGADGASAVPHPCPNHSGIFMSEMKAWRLTQYELRYKELRLDYQSDQKVWSAQRALYEKQILVAEAKLKAAEPDWYQQHKMDLGILGGFVLGAGVSVGITYSITRAVK